MGLQTVTGERWGVGMQGEEGQVHSPWTSWVGAAWAWRSCSQKSCTPQGLMVETGSEVGILQHRWISAHSHIMLNAA